MELIHHQQQEAARFQMPLPLVALHLAPPRVGPHSHGSQYTKSVGLFQGWGKKMGTLALMKTC